MGTASINNIVYILLVLHLLLFCRVTAFLLTAVSGDTQWEAVFLENTALISFKSFFSSLYRACLLWLCVYICICANTFLQMFYTLKFCCFLGAATYFHNAVSVAIENSNVTKIHFPFKIRSFKTIFFFFFFSAPRNFNRITLLKASIDS